ncbi:MAG: 4Fe-4S dicluster domain-containing protein [Desulfosalsimonadaceae bacterium]
MKIVQINKSQWASGIEKLKEGYRVFAPVKNQLFHDFKALEKDEQPDFNFQNTRLSPKSIVYPQSEVLFRYSLDKNSEEYGILKEVEKDKTPKAVIGIRPCDAYSFEVVKRNFDNPDYKDPYWLAEYEKTTFIGMACNAPCSTCFCTSAGTGPFDEKELDALVVDAGDHYLAKLLTEKGEKLFQAAGWGKEADKSAETRIEELKSAAESKITSSVGTNKLKEQKMLDLYEAPFWEDIAFACINCGTCTYVCPTCWCFDIQDETCGKSGVRIRNWDSCMYPIFTLHASGHNPRGKKVDRVRQRFMHKLKYYVDKYDNGIQCVGCGRCVQMCPVNIDIRRVCNMMNSYDPESCVCEVTSA